MLLDELSWAHWMLHQANLHWSCSEAKMTIYKDDCDYFTWSSSLIARNMPHSPTSSSSSSSPPRTQACKHKNHNGLYYTNKHMSESEEKRGRGLSNAEMKHYVISYWAPCAPFSAGSHRSNDRKLPTWGKQTKTYEYFIFSKHTKPQYGCDHFYSLNHHLCISSSG